MKKEYIKGYLLDEEDVGCEKYPVCFTCPYKCSGDNDDDEKKKKKKEIRHRYYQRHKDEIKEKRRLWREKQRLAKLLDQQRDKEKENENDNISKEVK